MKQIKFSHIYEKFKGLGIDKPVTLIDMVILHKDSLSEYFIEYDTKYYAGGEKHNYPLKDDEYILLFFMDYNGKLFTTLRRRNNEKEAYYISNVGSQFKVVIKQKVSK